MKKVLLLLFLFLGIGNVIHSQMADVYDTLRGNYYPYYFYNYPCSSYNTPLHSCFGPASLSFLWKGITAGNNYPITSLYWCNMQHQIDAEEIAVYMQPNSATQVIGIAFCDDCWQGTSERYHDHDSTWITPVRFNVDSGVFYFTLYDTNMNVIHSVSVNHDTLLTARYLHYKHYEATYPHDFAEHCYYHVHEYYFNTSIGITGNFYISMSKVGTNTISGTPLALNELCPIVLSPSDSFPLLPYEYRRYRSLPVADESVPWEDEICNQGTSSCLWPILEFEGDTCPEVQGLRWSRLGSGTTAFVQWDAGTNHRDWQLSYGPAGTPAGEGTVVDCPPAQCVLPGLATGHQYDIYVRARCRFARDEWTAWSGPLEIGFGNPGEGIDGMEGVFAELTPNPATGRVRVSCGDVLRMVEVYDLQGRRMLAQEASGTTLDLDISTLAAGRYTVIVHTAEGTGAKALVVQ